MTAVDLVSPLPRDECIKRLNRDVSSVWDIASGKPVVGSIEGDAITLRKRIYYRNSFQPALRGRLSDTPGGTRIHAEFGTIPLVPILIAAGVIFVIAIVVTAFALAKANVRLKDVPLAAIIAPLASLPFFAGLGFGVVALGRHLSRNDEQFLIAFLRKTLEARDAASG